MTLQNAAYIDQSARIFGKVNIGEGTSIWPHVSIRSEINQILIGCYSNIQDFVMLHVGEIHDLVIGDYCSICHHTTIHGATIGNNCFIGINSVIMDGAVIGANSVIGSMCYIKEGTIIPENSVVVGMPGRVIKRQDNSVANQRNANAYYQNALAYAEGNYRIWECLKKESNSK